MSQDADTELAPKRPRRFQRFLLTSVAATIGKHSEIRQDLRDLMQLPPHEQAVYRFYHLSTEGFFSGWDVEYLHSGVFDPAMEQAYREHPELAFADRYDAVRRMDRLVIDSARIKASDLVVDAGCGVGGTAMVVASEYGCSVLGLNLSTKQIDIARARTKARGLESKVTFEWCDCSQALSPPDETVDVILNIESACHYSHRRRFLAECARILRRGGRLAATDLVAADNLSPTDRERYIRPVESAWFLFDMESLSSYRRLLAEAGLHVTEAETLDSRFLPNGYIHRGLYQEMLRLDSQGGLNSAEREDLERVRAISEAILEGKVTIGRYVAERM